MLRQVLRWLLWPVRLPVRVLRRLLLTPTEGRRGADRTVEVDAIMTAVRRESAGGRGDGLAQLANPIFLDTTYPSAPVAFQSAHGHAAAGTVLPPMTHFRPGVAMVAQLANRLVFKLSQPLLRVQREFNRAVLFLLHRLDADLDRVDLARQRDHERIARLEERLRELEQQIQRHDRAA